MLAYRHCRYILQNRFNIFVRLCELRYCVHNISKIISPAISNLTVQKTNDMKMWWHAPKPPR
ncbi:hypothetical protein GEZ92_09770 [Streptococcus mitis]|nr:hypothetical protein [Streptococcus mitis]MQQ14638.1 hypothetical protein [Streptococcus mitis]MQQ45408.1 hypothetical protein [Streptococcus mitis]MQQ47447.1 hypothetical protein [Streptococcus mitis]MQQ58779.1 hypothetical protein [Streptococcus mitis]